MSWTTPSAVPRPDSIPLGHDPAVDGHHAAAKRFWRDLAASLPKRARVLEVGAGSCLVSRWMAAARPDLEMVASDAGDYPVDAAALGGIAFHPGAPIEALPFEDESFNAVVAQFAFEYTRRDEALAECVRVLRPGGGLAFMMHRAGGPLNDACAFRVAAAAMIVGSPSIPDLLRRAAALPTPAARAAMAKLSLGPALAGRLARLSEIEMAAGIQAPGLKSYLTHAADLLTSPTFATWVAAANAIFAEDAFIAGDQLRAACTDTDIEALSREAGALGLVAATAERRDISWAWRARKPAP